jgi:hypothetical protein
MTRSVRGRAPPGIKRGPGGGLAENDIGNGNNPSRNPNHHARQDPRRLYNRRRCARWGASVLDPRFDESPNNETWCRTADVIAKIIAGLVVGGEW